MNSQGKKIFKNASWIIICRIVQAILGLIVSMMTARYLGPTNFGLINYVASLVAFTIPLSKLGLDGILVQEFINDTEKDEEIIGTALVMNLITAVLGILGVFSFCMIVNKGEKETIIVCVLYSLILFTQSIEMIIYWFQAKLLSKYSSIASLVSYVIIALYKIYLLASEKSIYWFAISNALDCFLIGVILHILYKKFSKKRLKFSIDRAKSMFIKSKYYIFSGVMVIMFSQIDRIMLKLMLNDAAVGYYSVAVSGAGITSFIFSALIESMRPVILEGKKKSQEVYEFYVKQLYTVIIYGALFQSIFVAIFAKRIINLLYGPSYITAVAALKVIVWYTTFSYYGGAKDIWILAEGKQKYLVLLNFSGAIINIILNFYFISLYGVVGAAIASLITQFFTNIIMGILIKELRKNVLLLFQSLNPKNLNSIINWILQIIYNKRKGESKNEFIYR